MNVEKRPHEDATASQMLVVSATAVLNGTVMIIACPACATRYVVPDSAIGMEGRSVRCAKCRHNWFQDGPEPEMAEPEMVGGPQTAASEVPVQETPPRQCRPIGHAGRAGCG